MDNRTFKKICELVYNVSGIALNDNKRALVSARIGKRITALQMPDHRSYLDYLDQDDSGDELVQLLDVISTNVTSFFRESDHYDFVSQIIPDWLSQGQKRFRLWSAACSTGEEPYSLAMTLLDIPRIVNADLKILATDISTRVLAHSLSGVYPKKSLKTVSPKQLKLYFNRTIEAGMETYTVKDRLKELMTFKRLNLSKQPFPMRGPIDIVFCCNVMIYFDKTVREELVNEISRLLRPGGYLIVGHSESLSGINTDLKIVQPSIYRKDD
ncbi:MAG: CheR family methyltransferase [Candidatus Marinimicrobia bacterium]|nr:CheR family methyltransferase [Candidatus Neomarinimicrobiota bacterium]